MCMIFTHGQKDLHRKWNCLKSGIEVEKKLGLKIKHITDTLHLNPEHRWKKYFTFWLRKKIDKNFLPNSDMLYFFQKGDSQSAFPKLLIMQI